MGAERLLEADDEDVGHHHAAPDEAPVADPVLALDEGEDRRRVEGEEEDGVDPDGGPPPGRAGHQGRVEVRAVPVDQVHEGRRRPDRVLEVAGVGDHQLLEVDDGRDEEQVQEKEPQKEVVQLPFTEGDDAPHGGGGWRQPGPVGKAEWGPRSVDARAIRASSFRLRAFTP